MKRIFLIILDSCGAGAMPDATEFGDDGCHTLGSVSKSTKLHIPNMLASGLGNIDGLSFLGTTDYPTGAVARMSELSKGKDTTVGHWEIAGAVSNHPLPTYPEGFPEEVLEPFRRATGRGILCNKSYSGTEVIKEYGDEHAKTGDLIIYTSADSVFQIAAHEQVVPIEQLYEYCHIARNILTGKHSVGRVIARPFIGTASGNYTRTTNRHDFSLEPPTETMLDIIKRAGLASIAVGKISDIFAGRGITEKILTKSNTDGMAKSLALSEKDFHGLCFINLVDFDMLYGHRNDVDGYASALAEFDAWLPLFLSKMGKDDLVMITADHGCDPGDISTDHTREYTPLIIIGERVKRVNLGTRESFADIAATITDILTLNLETMGKSFKGSIL
jgi:phosphopentomutase